MIQQLTLSALSNLPTVVTGWTWVVFVWSCTVTMFYHFMITENKKNRSSNYRQSDVCNMHFTGASVVGLALALVLSSRFISVIDSFIVIDVFLTGYLATSTATFLRWWKHFQKPLDKK